MTKEFILPVEAEKQLSEIFTPQYMDAVKAACRRYLHEAAEKKPGMAEDGRILIEIAEKARELRQFLKKSSSALERVRLHLSEYYNIHDIIPETIDLQEKLRILENRCKINPASERAETPKKGREPGSTNTAQRALAFCLWEIYRKAHGKPAGRVWNEYAGREDGKLVKAARILGPSLGLGSDLAKEFRQIGELMDNKSKTK